MSLYGMNARQRPPDPDVTDRRPTAGRPPLIDRIARLLGGTANRRTVLQGLGAVAVSPALVAGFPPGTSRCAKYGKKCSRSRKCCSGLKCSKKKCACRTGTWCGGRCLDLSRDPANCGSCGRRCPADRLCRNGACSCPGCLDGATCADGTSPGYCGRGGNACKACAPGQVCDGGVCRCLKPSDNLVKWIGAAATDATLCLTAGTWTLDGILQIDRGVTLVGAGMDLTRFVMRPGDPSRGPVARTSGRATLRDLWIDGANEFPGLDVMYGMTTLANCRVSNCAGKSTTIGGALRVIGGLEMTGCEISDSRSVEGPGVHISDQGNVVMNGCSILRNVSAGDGGGVVLNDDTASLSMTDCIVAGNRAEQAGGGLFLYRGASLTRVSLTGNESLYNAGGAIAVAASDTVTLSACSITGNTATEGGGVYLAANGGSVLLTDGTTVSGNVPDNCAGESIPGCVN